ncbi:MAG: ABC transporter permease [Thermoanaerobaculia bacterium]
MPYELFIALRYLSASRKRAHVALVSAISIGGLALGVAALVVSIALLTGFQDQIRERLARDTPHLLLAPTGAAFFEDPASVRDAIAKEPGVRSIDPIVSGRGWITDARGRSALPSRYRASGSDLAPGQAKLTSSSAGQLGLGPGSRARILSSRTQMSPLGPAPIVVTVEIVSLIRESAGPSGPEIRLSLPDARALAGTESGVSAFEVRLGSPDAAPAEARDLSARLGPRVSVRSWRDLNVGLTFALRMEKVLIFVTVFLIVVVASLNVVADLALLVVEKRRDLGVLATLGAPAASLSRIYWWLGGAIAAIGTLLGVAAGTGISWSLERSGILRLPADVYLLSHVPFAVHLRDVALVVAFSLATGAAATYFPARAAARVGPAESLRLSR